MDYERLPLADIEARLDQRVASVRAVEVNGSYIPFQHFARVSSPSGFVSEHDLSDVATFSGVVDAFNEQLSYLMAFRGIEHPDLDVIASFAAKNGLGIGKAHRALQAWKDEQPLGRVAAWLYAKGEEIEEGAELRSWQFIKSAGRDTKDLIDKTRRDMMLDLLCFEPYANGYLAMQVLSEEMERFQRDTGITLVRADRYSGPSPTETTLPAVTPEFLTMAKANFFRHLRGKMGVPNEDAYLFAEEEGRGSL